MGMGVDLDIYSKLLSNFFNLWDRNLLLINWCIESEFKTAPVAQSGSLMRGNTFLSKLESEFASTWQFGVENPRMNVAVTFRVSISSTTYLFHIPPTKLALTSIFAVSMESIFVASIQESMALNT